MKGKIWFSLLILFFLVIGMVSANENVTDGDIQSEEYVGELEIADDDTSVSALDNDDVLQKTIKVSGNSFSTIKTKIDSANDGDIIKLTGKTYYSSGEKILVKKKITIMSTNGAVLDAKGLSGIFDSSTGLTLKNLHLINSNSVAVNIGGPSTIINCTFENNCGGIYAICDDNSKISIDSSTFKNHNGVAVEVQGVDMDIVNSVFDGNMGYLGGAISIHSATVNIDGSTFTNNFAESSGGALYFSSSDKSNILVANSMFINNSANRGSSIDDWCSCRLENNVFINNKGDDTVSNIGFLDTNTVLTNNIIKNNVGTSSVAALSLSATGNNYGDLVQAKLINSKTNAPLSNKKIVIMAYNNDYGLAKYSANTNSNGIAKIFATESWGNYDFVAIADMGNYKVVSSLINVEIKVANVVAKPTSLTTTYNSGKSFNILVLNKNTKKSVAGAKLYVSVYSNKLFKDYYVKTDVNGKVSIPVSALGTGKYDVKISSNDFSDSFNLATAKSSIKINKAPAKVKVSKLTAKYKKSKYFKVTVKAYNKPLKNVKIKVKVYTGKKYKIYKLKTNKKGLTKINTKKLKKGAHKVIISSGNKNYKISAKSKITII